jgi:hypothetical protein
MTQANLSVPPVAVNPGVDGILDALEKLPK